LDGSKKITYQVKELYKNEKITLSIVLTLILILSTVGIASAITDGEPDGNAHPYVGLMIAQDENGTPMWRCSGTLLSETVFLTAGHCTEAPAAHVEIWFYNNEADIRANGYPYTGQVGGPNFLGDSNIVAGVTSFGINGNFAGTGGVFRMDRADALNFVLDFLD